MTDVENAEVYVKQQILKHNRDVVLRPKNVDTYIDELKQAHLDGLVEGRKEKWHDLRKELEQWKQEWQDAQIKSNEEGFARTTLQIKYAELEKENEELKEKLKHRNCIDCSNHGNQIEVLKLKARMEKMKKSCLDVMKVQGINLTDDYMAGMYNGMVVVYNSCFLNGFNELKMDFCSKNENGKWELSE